MSVRTKERRLETTDASSIRERSDNVRFALLLTYITIGWMTIEGAASLLLGWLIAGSHAAASDSKNRYLIDKS